MELLTLKQKEIDLAELKIDSFEIHSRPEVPVKWGTITDPWGNRLGFFEYLDKREEQERIKPIIGTLEG